jgi:trk system potassium uptake protein TrkH
MPLRCSAKVAFLMSEHAIRNAVRAPLAMVSRWLGGIGVLTRTTLGSALLGCVGLDLLLRSSLTARVAVTGLQSTLVVIALWFGYQRTRAPATRAQPRGSVSESSTVLALAALAAVAVAHKGWIAVQADDALRDSYTGSYRVTGVAATLASVFALFAGERRFTRYFATFAEHPARQTALSFIGLALLGAFLLTLPPCVREPSHVSFLNALFMATSAVCVTGLAVHGVVSEYTDVGQAVMLALTQVGGIGIMVLSASIVVLTGRKLRARSTAMLTEVLDADSAASLRGSIRRIVLYTLAIEALGVLALYPAFARYPQLALDAHDAHPLAGSGSILWAAVFHAVSAFCNAGFTLTRDGLVPFADSYAVCVPIMVLIVLGGLGFPVLTELASRLRAVLSRRRPTRASLHVRTVLMLNAALIVLAAVVLALVEWSDAFGGRAWHERALLAVFHSVSLRTAGFNTVDIASFGHASLMFCTLCMLVGASPGGTGGGIKVTTVAVLFATLRAELRGHDEPSLFDRRLPRATVRRAISVTFVAFTVLTSVVFLLFLWEPHAPLELAFEAVSAFGTVGLSANLTPRLGVPGKLVLVATMLIGRVGPLTVALAASERAERAHHHRPHERVLIG